MATLGFSAADFQVFKVEGFNQRMAQLYASVRPKLLKLGDALAPEMARKLHLEFFPHVAKHARRTVNPPPETWCAFGPSAKGYKRYPVSWPVHFERRYPRAGGGEVRGRPSAGDGGGAQADGRELEPRAGRHDGVALRQLELQCDAGRGCGPTGSCGISWRRRWSKRPEGSTSVSDGRSGKRSGWTARKCWMASASWSRFTGPAARPPSRIRVRESAVKKRKFLFSAACWQKVEKVGMLKE